MKAEVSQVPYSTEKQNIRVWLYLLAGERSNFKSRSITNTNHTQKTNHTVHYQFKSSS